MIICPNKVQNASQSQIKRIIYLYTYYKLIIVRLVLHKTSFRVQTICYALQVLDPKADMLSPGLDVYVHGG